MSKVAVVYWSSTGNTEAMANAVADGVKGKGGEAVLHTCEDFDGSKVTEYDAIALDARQWEMKFWKIQSSSRCLMDVKMHSKAKISLFLVLTDGEMANGCATGKIPARKLVQTLYVKV